MPNCCDSAGNCQLKGSCRSTLGSRASDCPMEELVKVKHLNTLAAFAAFWAIITLSFLAYWWLAAS